MIDVDYNIYKMVLEENMKLIVENHNQKEAYKHLEELYEVALKDYDEATKRIDMAIEKLNTQLAFTSSYQLNYQSAMFIIEETKQILSRGSE